MVTITLPPELERIVTEQARQQGTTPELLTLDKLHGIFQPIPALPSSERAGTMADFFADFIGSIHSGDIVPGGANLSEDTGRKFKELMLKRYQDGKV